ncbi:hypothetical protein D0809_13425 [Flavobacterium circumlabens]|uniref:Uncharacterized protein n=1 Tax=Flavobacterium circumlabens TaxID=2133765 RepID=A0A4Y7UD04_9FLAO|nr:hypothetical protein D0809_13425 [Flavobacterium circumlabens]
MIKSRSGIIRNGFLNLKQNIGLNRIFDSCRFTRIYLRNSKRKPAINLRKKNFVFLVEEKL